MIHQPRGVVHNSGFVRRAAPMRVSAIASSAPKGRVWRRSIPGRLPRLRQLPASPPASATCRLMITSRLHTRFHRSSSLSPLPS